MIDLMPNITFFYQLGIFLLALGVLHVLVFRPVLRILEKRRELTEASRQAARTLDQKTEKMILQYNEKLQEARGEGIEIKEKLKKEGEAQAKTILIETRKEIDASLEDSRKNIQNQTKLAQDILSKYTQELSQEMASKLVGRKVA